jgi:photosystem II stability/assembly factor-like uncharacterized protein
LITLSVFLSGCQGADDRANQQAGAQETQNRPADSAEQDPQWAVIAESRLDHKASFAAFVDTEFGITGTAINVFPYVYYSTNGGQSWTRSETATGALMGMDITDVQSIWQCGFGNFNTSKDGAQTWQPFTSPLSEDCRLLTFVDDKIGWAASVDKLAGTDDGGESWETISLPVTVRKIAAISLRTATDGYILDFDYTLYSTSDGGDSWSASMLEIEDSDLALMDLTLPSAAVRFVDDQNGLIILNLAGGGKSDLCVLNTNDGGQTWERESLPAGLGIVFLSHDARFLTVSEIGGTGAYTILERQLLE